MTYRLRKLAAGSYDVILDGVIIAGVVRCIVRERVTWTAGEIDTAICTAYQRWRAQGNRPREHMEGWCPTEP